jgi:hypothetical protein
VRRTLCVFFLKFCPGKAEDVSVSPQFPQKFFVPVPACFRIKKYNEENTKAAAYLIRHLNEQDIDLPTACRSGGLPH